MGERARDVDRTRSHGRRGDSEQRSGDQLNVLEELADFCMSAGEFTTAIEYFQQVLDLLNKRVEGGLEPSILRRMAGCFRSAGDFDRALGLLEQAEPMVKDSPVELAKVLNERAWALLRKGNYEESAKECAKVLRGLSDSDRETECAGAYNCLGSIALRKGEADKAWEFYEGALAMYRRLNDRDGVGRCCNNLGLVAKDRGDWDAAARYQELALQMARDMGHSLHIGIRLNNVGITYFKKGDPEKALACWEEALSLFQRTGEKWEIASPCANLGNYYRLRRDWQKASEFYARARQISERNGDRRGVALSLEFQACLLMDRGHLDQARQRLQEALKTAEEIAPKGDLMSEVLRNLGELRILQGDVEAAEACCHRALSVAMASGNRYEEACILRVMGMAAAAREMWEDAEEHFRRAIQCLDEIGGRYELARTCVDAARCLAGVKSDGLRLKPLLLKARSIFEAMDARYELGRTLIELAGVEILDRETGQAQQHMEEARALIPEDEQEESSARLADILGQVDKTLATVSVSGANDLAEFNRLCGQVASVTDFRARMREILRIMVRETAAERGLLVLKPSAEEEGGVEVVLGLDRDRDSWALRFVEELINNGNGCRGPIVSNHPAEDADLSLPPEKAERIASLLFVSFVVNGEALGGIYVDRVMDDQDFGQKEVDFAVAFAGVAAASFSDAEARKVREENENLREQLEERQRFSGIVTQNKGMLDVIRSIAKLDRASPTVLIQGETGTGKELVAQAIHDSSCRKDGPFVTINCAALAEGVLETELFGHVKGAFTDARTDREGLFAQAAGGTVFLDEVDKTSRNFQEKLLRVVDKREFKPVGSSIRQRVDFRIVCATNRDLTREVEEGRFLPDLYYRLKVIRLTLPLLSERREDIPLLAAHFLERYCKRLDKRLKGFSPEAMELMVGYGWPGNVRQLKHEVERVVAFASDGDQITLEDLSEELRNWGALIRVTGTGALAEAVEQMERRLIQAALERNGGNRTRTAASLGLSRRGLLNKIKRYQLAG
ncbi:MAG: sigma 54-interacting transcriptional regulator [Candidatus Eisenbacteria sp.]|nr:sigma 54-interacting transcriptional regulator [Candidatus Eisenbacteria bacterium]